jgi:hypothetical protein
MKLDKGEWISERKRNNAKLDNPENEKKKKMQPSQFSPEA